MAGEVVRLERDGDVAVIVLDSPPVNSLSQPVVSGLMRRLAEANADPSVVACVVLGAGDNFIAGADIGELQAAAGAGAKGDPAPGLSDALEAIDAQAKPVVMAIDGFALGGGLETALAGHYRVGTTRARVGLPELKLGLLPGAGGTQRLPRIAGLAKAAEWMLASTELKAAEALATGVLNQVVEPAQRRTAAVAVARPQAPGTVSQGRATHDNRHALGLDEARRLASAAKAALGDKARNQVHQDLCLDAIVCGLTEGYAAGLRRERENFAKCLGSAQAAGMIHMFFAPRAATKVPGVTDQKLPTKVLTKGAVLGGGTMGSGIATALLEAGLRVTLKEVSAEASEAARRRVEANFLSRVKKGKLPQAKFDELMSRLLVSTSFNGFDQMEIVIEAVIENVELKQQVFADLERHCAADCILASNTSTIDLEVIGERTQAAARIVGTHFFSPAHVMPLVEVVRSRHTSGPVLNQAIALVKQMKKTPVTVGNCVGFLVNRIFFPYGQAAGLLVDGGIDPYRIDRAMVEWGMPMGPFRMSDLAGVDVAKFAGGILGQAYADRNYVSTLVDHLFAAERFGQKAGRGYYRYEAGSTQALPDAELAELCARARRDAGNPPALQVSDEEIVERLLFGVVNEACRCLDEGIAIRPSDIDVASVMGMGFPVYRGGVMKWADMVGVRHVFERLSQWAAVHGPIYRPADYLRQKAESGGSLLV